MVLKAASRDGQSAIEGQEAITALRALQVIRARFFISEAPHAAKGKSQICGRNAWNRPNRKYQKSGHSDTRKQNVASPPMCVRSKTLDLDNSCSYDTGKVASRLQLYVLPRMKVNTYLHVFRNSSTITLDDRERASIERWEGSSRQYDARAKEPSRKKSRSSPLEQTQNAKPTGENEPHPLIVQSKKKCF